MDTSTGTERRLWIGNLDPRVTEFTLLKIVQKYGAIEKFDLMFHRSGPQAGMPRGYAFVTYVNRADAAKAKQLLDNVLIGQKTVRVMWAHMVNHDEVDKPKPEVNIPALAMSKGEKKTDKEIQIQLIEAKLKMMEKKSETELKINDTVASKTPVIQYNKQPVGNSSNCSSSFSSSSNGSKMRNGVRRQDKYNKPYSKNKTHR